MTNTLLLFSVVLQIQVNMVPRAKTSVVEANITLTFHVDVDEDNSIIGRIEVLVNDGTHLLNYYCIHMAVCLTMFVTAEIKLLIYVCEILSCL